MSRRALTLCCVLAAILLGVVFVLNRKGGGRGGGQVPEGAKSPLTALEPRAWEKPGVRVLIPEPPAGDPPDTFEVNARNLIAGRASLEVSQEQVDATLERSGRAPESLIAAQAILGDYAYLREAAESHPDDPRIQFWILANDVFPDERAEWLARYKESDPDNALANYLAAEEGFRAMDYETGMAELRAAVEKAYQDPSDDLRGEVGQFYQSTQLFDSQTAQDGSARVNSKPHVERLQGLSERLIEHLQTLGADGDEAAAAELVQLGMRMLQTVGDHSGADAIDSRVAMLFMQEKLQRAAGDPDGRLEDLQAERERVGTLGQQVQTILQRDDLLDDRQVEEYARRLHDGGELAAADWLVDQVGTILPLPGGE